MNRSVHCDECYADFRELTGFDMHRQKDKCVDPVTFGYVLHRGMWVDGYPDEPPINLQRWRESLKSNLNLSENVNE